MSEKSSTWYCCKCDTVNSSTDVCFYCGHEICSGCKRLTHEEVIKAQAGADIAKAWLTGQKKIKENFNGEAFKINEETTKLEALRDEIESQIEPEKAESNTKKTSRRT
jgi:hypothetical protein